MDNKPKNIHRVPYEAELLEPSANGEGNTVPATPINGMMDKKKPEE